MRDERCIGKDLEGRDRGVTNRYPVSWSRFERSASRIRVQRVTVTRTHSVQCSFVLLASWGGVRMSPLGTAAIVVPIVPAPDDT
jgi:hypothetical protein